MSPHRGDRRLPRRVIVARRPVTVAPRPDRFPLRHPIGNRDDLGVPVRQTSFHARPESASFSIQPISEPLIGGPERLCRAGDRRREIDGFRVGNVPKNRARR